MKSYKDNYRDFVNKNNILVTIFVVTYNRAQYLKLTIDSILKQTYKNFCLVIVDNASTDDTQNVLKQYNDNRLFYFCHANNIGGIGNIDSTINMALTPYFITFHDDDLMLPEMVEKELNVMQNNNFAIISVLGKHIDENGNELKYNRPTSSTIIEYEKNTNSYLRSFLLSSPYPIYCPSVMFNRDFLINNSLHFNPDAGPACDIFLWSEIERCSGKIGVIPQELFEYRLHTQQDSSQNQGILQGKLFRYFISIPYYKDFLTQHYSIFIRYLIMLLAEIMLSYRKHKNTEKVINIINELDNICTIIKSNPLINLIFNICKKCPRQISILVYFVKKTHNMYKEFRFN